MTLSIQRGIYTYCFVPFDSAPPPPDPGTHQVELTFSNSIEAAAFLRGLSADIHILRRIARSAGIHNQADYDDTEISELVARELVRKQLTLLARHYVPASTSSEQGEAKAAPRPASTPSPGPKTPEPESDTFRDPELEQQISTLMEAARNGTPFCEECERARRQTA